MTPLGQRDSVRIIDGQFACSNSKEYLSWYLIGDRYVPMERPCYWEIKIVKFDTRLLFGIGRESRPLDGSSLGNSIVFSIQSGKIKIHNYTKELTVEDFPTWTDGRRVGILVDKGTAQFFLDGHIMGKSVYFLPEKDYLPLFATISSRVTKIELLSEIQFPPR